MYPKTVRSYSCCRRHLVKGKFPSLPILTVLVCIFLMLMLLMFWCLCSWTSVHSVSVISSNSCLCSIDVLSNTLWCVHQPQLYGSLHLLPSVGALGRQRVRPVGEADHWSPRREVRYFAVEHTTKYKVPALLGLLQIRTNKPGKGLKCKIKSSWKS